MSRSGSGKLDPVVEWVDLLFHQKSGSASFGVFELSGSGLYELNYWIHL
jgi:hypothetical protein